MDMLAINKIERLKGELEGKKDVKLNMIIGLDGFVDEIVHVVDKRQDFNNFTRVQTIEELGQRIVRASGLSTNIEFVTVQTKLGGNGPILANALLEYGVQLTYIGALGKHDIHPVFKPMAEKTRMVYSICEPGHTDAVEFEDGKLMLGKLTSLSELTWTTFKELVGSPQDIAAMIEQTHLFGMENWTMIPGMSNVWEGLISEVLPLLPESAQKPFAFFDLADPEKRTKDDMCHAMKLIGQFEQKFRAILGLNEKELYEIADVLDIEVDKDMSSDERLKLAITQVYEKLGIYALVVHPTKEAACCIDHVYYRVDGPYCPKPALTTGAGDNFNAGFCLAQALGLDAESSLVMGVATSGFYVRNAKSPTFEQLQGFLVEWVNM